MNSSEFKEWRKSHSTGMMDLTFAHPDDIFIFTRFTSHQHSNFEGEQILYAEDVEEAIWYIRNIFLYDVLKDALDDLEFDFKSPFDETQKDTISLMNYWFKLGKISNVNMSCLELEEFCDDFNLYFNGRKDLEYEIKILNGANELRRFLTERYSMCEEFDKKLLDNVCSKKLFAGKRLKEFVEKLFR